MGKIKNWFNRLFGIKKELQPREYHVFNGMPREYSLGSVLIESMPYVQVVLTVNDIIIGVGKSNLSNFKLRQDYNELEIDGLNLKDGTEMRDNNTYDIQLSGVGFINGSDIIDYDIFTVIKNVQILDKKIRFKSDSVKTHIVKRA